MALCRSVFLLYSITHVAWMAGLSLITDNHYVYGRNYRHGSTGGRRVRRLTISPDGADTDRIALAGR